MFAVSFYASCFVSRGNSVGKKLIRLDWEKVVYWLLFTLANTLLKLHFRIKFKLLNKFSIEDTPNYLLEVYLAITSTISYLDNVLN